MSSFADALRALNRIKAKGIVDDYAIADAMALLFSTEPVPTYDAAALLDLPDLNRTLLDEILTRHGVEKPPLG
jgi:hypothetical protein